MSAEIYRRVLDPIRGVPVEALPGLLAKIALSEGLTPGERVALGNLLLRATTVIGQEAAVIDLGEKLWIENLEAQLAQRLQEEG